jgi:Rha family phage regulatory protein
MENLVIQEGKQALTTSLKIAETFGKRHADVLRAIENLKCSQKFRERNFALSSYSTLQNKVAPMYNITRQGFTMLVMGFTGEIADQFKEAYIEAFDAMEEYIRNTKGKTLSEEEAAMIHELLNFYKYLNNCKKAEETHKKRFIAINSQDKTKEERADLAQEFYKMRNALLEIGNTKELETRYKRYCLQHPNVQYHPKASKFVMLFTMDKYEVVRHAIFDFLKIEWYTDEYSIHFSAKAKNVAQKTNLDLKHKNETNLFQEEETDLIDMSKLRYLVSQLLTLKDGEL